MIDLFFILAFSYLAIKEDNAPDAERLVPLSIQMSDQQPERVSTTELPADGSMVTSDGYEAL